MSRMRQVSQITRCSITHEEKNAKNGLSISHRLRRRRRAYPYRLPLFESMLLLLLLLLRCMFAFDWIYLKTTSSRRVLLINDLSFVIELQAN